ncbi:hypothetical protein HRR99_18005 [Agrobacterium vaccinii]|uniref:hypothetical protein n=1 Tax=Agrobacterium vaccinii TaxID=2735528 RepID=UPI001E2B714F|nr:hypothetical protein [Agrobacterium vaccinii]UHS63468.1 hypothetical protein HRR99_18005 [Agrobacterium vaccinii]
MEEDLGWLKAVLIEHGGIELVIAVERAAREAMPPIDARSELKLLLDELEAVLVQGFEIVSFTMGKLKAKTLQIQEDFGAIDAESGVVSETSRKDAKGVALSKGELEEWGQFAREASEILGIMRRRYDIV